MRRLRYLQSKLEHECHTTGPLSPRNPAVLGNDDCPSFRADNIYLHSPMNRYDDCALANLQQGQKSTEANSEGELAKSRSRNY